MDPQTDVSSAQSFDVTSFLNTVVNAGASIVGQRVAPSQNNGQPSATQTPNLRATGPAGSGVQASAGMTPQQMTMIVGGAVALVAVIYLLRK